MTASFADARDLSESVSDGLDCLFEISESADASCAATLSRMRDALALIRAGVDMRATVYVPEALVSRLDAIIASLGGIDGAPSVHAREMARAYLAELEAMWGQPKP